jgi:LysR family transcriptional regulator, low CO2-responsive transcriptional regulator
VRKLEEEYDVLLFDRQRKQVLLTPAGEQLLDITRRLFDAESQAAEFLSESRALRSGRLSIMADAVHHVLKVLTAFRDRYPGVQVTVRSGNTASIAKALINYEADIGVVGDMPPMRDVEVIPLNSSSIVACAPAGHPLARQKSVSFAELTRYPLVGRENGSKTRRKVEDVAKAQGVDICFAIEAEGREAMREIVAMGSGIGFVSDAEFGHDPRLIRLRIKGMPLMTEAMLCLRERAQRTTIRAFFELARQLQK